MAKARGQNTGSASDSATEQSDLLFGTGADNTMDGLSGNDWMFGAAGNDTMDGGAGNDKLYGGDGNDTLDGGAGNDKMDGGSGDDTFLGSLGKDKMSGGDGADTFIYTDAAQLKGDKIKEFTSEDTLDISAITADGGTYDLVQKGPNVRLTVTTSDGETYTLKLQKTDVETVEAGLVTAPPPVETVELPPEPVNTAPDAVADTATTNEDTAVTINVLANDTDADGDTLTISSPILTGLGSATIVNNELVYDPAGAYDYLNDGETETVTIEYTVDDGNGGTATASATVTVTGVTDGTVEVVGTAGTTELRADSDGFNFDLSTYDNDPTTDGIQFGGETDGSGVGLISSTGFDGVTYTGATIDSAVVGTVYDDTFDFSGTNLYGIEVIDLGDGNDTFIGSSGDDTVYGGEGSDTLDGRDGSDTYVFGNDSDGVPLNGGYDSITDTGTGAGDYDMIVANKSNTLIGLNNFGPESGIEEISAGYDDTGALNTGVTIGVPNIMTDAAGTGWTLDFSATTLTGIESIQGSDHDDTIVGSSGDDVIVGNKGSDTLTGGAGADTFVYVDGVEQNDAGVWVGEGDVITDFTYGEDMIDLSVLTAQGVGHQWLQNGADATLQLTYAGQTFDLATLEGVDTTTWVEADWLL